LARKALSDLANADLEQQMIHVFCDRLQHLEDEQRQAIIQSLSSLSEPILVRSHFALTLEAQQALITTLKTQFAPDSAIEFVTTSDLNCGIEVKLSGQKLAWSLDSYLQTLEQELFSTLTHKGTLHNEPHF
jgi:F-type H+-transporting ATPase subunit b